MILRYEELTEEALLGRAAAGPLVAVLPAGALEAHGPHLPLGTDLVIARALAERAAEAAGERAVLLPPVSVGVSGEHLPDGDAPAATLTQEAVQFIEQVDGITSGLARAGIRRLLFVNGHGGNIPALDIAALNARRRHGMIVANAHWLDFGLPEGLTDAAEARADVHGGWIETSLMLDLAPETVLMDRAAANSPRQAEGSLLFPSGPVNWGWKSGDLAPGGWIGHPERAARETGIRLRDHAVDGLSTLISELSEMTLP
jgi:creatinine amidohydrolase